MNVARHFLRAPNMRSATLEAATRDKAGGKGAGLLRLPLNWYPATVIISPGLWTDLGGVVEADVFDEFVELEGLLARLAGESPAGQLLLRSSVEFESIDDRGRYLSVQIHPTVEGLYEGINQIWAQAAGLSTESHPVGLLIQPLVEGVLTGHLSNEHRVSRESTRWTLQTTGEPPVGRQVQAASPAGEGPLLATNRAFLDLHLRQVAKRLSDYPNRIHLEWVWDGRRVWIVQADPVPPTLGPPPGDHFDAVRGERVDPAALRVWGLLDDLEALGNRWPKVRAVNEFRASELGGPEFWIVTGDLVESAPEEDLLADLELLCSGHLLIRTDIEGEGLHPNLKRSDALIDAHAALSHLKEVTAASVAVEIEPSRICFIAHRFTRARASAWVAAWPNRADVRVDSIWGLGDGLQYLPHDSAWINTDTGEVRRNVNAKTLYLDTTENGVDWRYETTPTEWIWKASATIDQLRTVATSTRRIADNKGGPVIVLWFIGVLDGYDADCLAWVTMPGLPNVASDLTEFDQQPRMIVRDFPDLESLREVEQASVIRLEPSVERLRDNSFVEQIIELTRTLPLSVEIAGSPLAHAYYQLEQAGVPVLCLDNPQPPTQSFNKLVRDGIVDKVAAQGERVVSYTASEAERRALLKKKLVEEAIEVLEAESEGALIEELADVEEVLAALRDVLGIDQSAVTQLQEQKRARRGGFALGSVLIETGGRDNPVQPELFPSRDLWRPEDEPQFALVDNELTLDLVPPPPERRAPFSVKIGTYEVRGRYESHSVTLELIERPRTPEESQDQPSLFS